MIGRQIGHRIGWAALWAVCLWAAPAGGVLVYEDFEYNPTGSLVPIAGQTGGFGWDGAWRSVGDNQFRTIHMPAPDYQWSPANLQTGARGAQRPLTGSTTALSRDLAAPGLTADNSTLWFGLVIADNANGLPRSAQQAFALADGDFSGSGNIPILAGGTVGIGFQITQQGQLDARAWGTAGPIGDSADITIPVANSIIGMLVGRIDWGTADTGDAETHSVTAWLVAEADIGTEPSTAAGVTLSGLNFDQSGLNVFTTQDNKAFTMDQLRFARTYADLVGPGTEDLPGDANLDDLVDTQDFSILKGHFAQDPALWGEGNFNTDTIVDTQDFSILKAHFGEGGAAPAPEPAALSLLGLGGLVLLRRRRA